MTIYKINETFTKLYTYIQYCRIHIHKKTVLYMVIPYRLE